MNPITAASSQQVSARKSVGRFTGTFFDGIARDVGSEWPSLARRLGIPERDIVSFRGLPGRELDRAVSMLERWSERFDSEATAGQDKAEELAVALATIGLIGVVKKHLSKSMARRKAVKDADTSLSCTLS